MSVLSTAKAKTKMETLSASSFIKVLRRFLFNRGSAVQIWSNRSTDFTHCHTDGRGLYHQCKASSVCFHWPRDPAYPYFINAVDTKDWNSIVTSNRFRQTTDPTAAVETSPVPGRHILAQMAERIPEQSAKQDTNGKKAQLEWRRHHPDERQCCGKKNHWPNAVVMKALPSKGNIVRNVVVRAIKHNKTKVYTRPVSELVLLISPKHDAECVLIMWLLDIVSFRY